MKKVLFSIVLMFAVCATSSVMAQDVNKEACPQKTECAKSCCKDKKCCKADADKKKCCNSDEKKCCKADKKCCKENKQAVAGKK